jgi:hypothetical protein
MSCRPYDLRESVGISIHSSNRRAVKNHPVDGHNQEKSYLAGKEKFDYRNFSGL